MYKALIVDDDRWVLEDIKRCFPFSEFGVELAGSCGDAEQAMCFIRLNRPDLVITDICMGRESGLDLMRQCRLEGIDALFIILSGYDNFSFAQEAMRYKAFRYMLKPIRDSEARAVIQSAVEELNHAKPARVTDGSEAEEDALSGILRYISSHYNQPITLEGLSQEFFINRTYICDLFRERLNSTFGKYLLTCRLNQARELLERTDMAIGDIARQVGFEDTHYFSRVFKQAEGITPVGYRNLHKKGSLKGE